MDLLENEPIKKKNEKTKAQKVVLILLIISIILCLIVGIAMAYLAIKGEEKEYSIAISGSEVSLEDLKLTTSNNGTKYISLQALCNKLNYKYYNGEYKIPGEAYNKGYIDNQKNIVQFYTDSNTIFKTTYDSNTDYEYYTLTNNVLEYNGNIYIALDDLSVALNLIVTYSGTNNQTSIETPENWVLAKEESFKELDTTISSEPENLRAMSYGYVIINKDNKYGVISLETGSEVIGTKYASLVYCEYTNNFIVSNTSNKYGTIAKSGNAEISLQYDSFEIINYNPLLYKVERLERTGIIKSDGTIINEIDYDSIGYPENKDEEIQYSLIVPNLNENIPQSIIVCKDKKYGLINLATGKEIIPCISNGIYSKESANGIFYVKTQNKKEYLLEDFVESLNKLTTSIE